jgi:hypothetical protein
LRSTARRSDSGGAEIVIVRRSTEIAARTGLTLGASRRWCGAGSGAAIVALHAQHPAGAGIGVEPEHAPIGRKPFQAVMRFAVRTHARTFDVGERAGPFPADAIEDLIQRADLARLHPLPGAVRLSRCRFLDRGCAEQEETDQRRKVPHGPPFSAESLNST